VSALALCGAGLGQGQGQLVFSSKDLGIPEIDITITFTPESERTYRVEYSKLPAHPDLGMFYTYFYMCAARKIALERGFDRFGMFPVKDEPSFGIGFFLRPGEDANQVLGAQFSNAAALSVTNPSVSQGCDAMASNRRSVAP
jgi:hypothetical protein